ncbi:MAG: CotH kinase family protein, partial [Anaerolineae bacterium]|nr:CotH kinase family protein [Anaerolineae bacterium]
YWGLYNLVERPDDAFMAAYFGGAEEDWQTINHAETTSNGSERFKTLHELADKGNLAAPENYASLQAYLDVPHFIDYLIVNWYSGNLDWGFNNWYAGVGSDSGPVRYFVWDGERTWFEGAEIYMEYDEYNDQPNRVKPLLKALLDNSDFRIELADRLFKHLFNDGALTESQARHRWQAINQIVEPAIIAESARWGDVRFDPPLTQADWFKARDDVSQQIEGNPARMIAIAREAGYYPELDPPLFNQPAGPITPGISLNLETPAAQESIIFYTTDGSDPRLPGTGAVSPMATIYRKPLVLTATTHIKARAFGQGAWSALNEAIYRVDEAKSTLQITEIMYNPSGGDDYEFIELKNTGNTPLNLARMSFEGIRYTFPPGDALLSPGALRVLVRNPQAFSQRYPAIPIGGVYQGQLSNKGETITLRDATGEVVVSVRYDDDNGWPVSADGRGDSLVLINPHRDPNKAINWRASHTLNGTPTLDEP